MESNEGNREESTISIFTPLTLREHSDVEGMLVLLDRQSGQAWTGRARLVSGLGSAEAI